jgi:hypothetical protein
VSSLLDKPDGQPIPGTEGTLTAAQQADMLGLKETAVKPRPLPLTPAQARLAQEDRWPDESLRPPDYAAGTVSGAEAVAAAMGARPEDFDATPLGSMPEGMPIPQPGIRPKLKPRDEGATTTKTSTPLDASAKAELAADFRAHAAKVAEVAASAKQSGDAAREAKAAAAVRASAEVGEALKARGVL